MWGETASTGAVLLIRCLDHCGTWQHGEKGPVAISVSVETVLTSLGVHGSTLWETLIRNRSLEPDWLIESSSITYRRHAWPRALTLTASARHTVPGEQRPQIPTGCFPLVFYPIFVTLFLFFMYIYRTREAARAESRAAKIGFRSDLPAWSKKEVCPNPRLYSQAKGLKIPHSFRTVLFKGKCKICCLVL